MTKKKLDVASEVKGWTDVITKSFEDSRKKAEMLEPNHNMMRYYTEYARSIYSNTERMNLIWDMFERKAIDQETAQYMLSSHQEEMIELINSLIGYMRVDRKKFHTHNFDKPENHLGELTLHDLKRGLNNKEGHLYFSAAIKEDDLYQDESHIALSIEERIPEGVDFLSIHWKIDYVLEDYIVLKVWLDDFTIEDSLLEKIKKY